MKRLLTLVAFTFISLCSSLAENVNVLDNISISQESVNFTSFDIDIPENTMNVLYDPEGKYIAFECLDPKTADNKKPDFDLNVYSLADKRLLWSKHYKYGKVRWKFVEQGILEMQYNSVVLLSKTKGVKKVLFPEDCNFVGATSGKLLISTTGSSYACIFSQEEGRQISGKGLAYDGGMSENIPIDNNRGFIIGEKLYQVNWNTGVLKWLKADTYEVQNEMNISKGNIFSMIGSALGSALLGGLIGVPMVAVAIPYSSTNYSYAQVNNNNAFIRYPSRGIGGLYSNIVNVNGQNYFADSKKMMCFDNDMNVKWESYFDGKHMKEFWNKEKVKQGGRSVLMVNGKTAYLVNMAVGIVPSGAMAYYGKPFIASFNISNGKMIEMKSLSNTTDAVVSTFKNEKGIRMLFKDREAEYTFDGNNLNLGGTRDTTRVGRLVCYLTDDMCYVKNADEDFVSVKAADGFTPVLTSQGKIVNLDEQFVSAIYNKEQIFMKLGDADGKTFYKGGKDKKELWCFANGKASLISDDVAAAKIKDNILIYYTSDGKLHIALF